MKRRAKHKRERDLTQFWAASARKTCDRLALLKKYAGIQWATIPPEMLKGRRRQYLGYKRRVLKSAGFGNCWVCLVRTALSWHHVIQLQHGGDNRTNNLVAICEGCHAEVHVWLKKEREFLVPEEVTRPMWNRDADAPVDR